MAGLRGRQINLARHQSRSVNTTRHGGRLSDARQAAASVGQRAIVSAVDESYDACPSVRQ
jgi:hypothetical protein